MVNKVIDFKTRKTLDETYDVQKIASQFLYIIDEEMEYSVPTMPMAVSLMYLAKVLLSTIENKDYMTIAQLIESEYT